MSDKTLFQQFLDTKCADTNFTETVTGRKFKRSLKLTFICLFISTFAFLTLHQKKSNLLETVIEDLSYDCDDLNRLYRKVRSKTFCAPKSPNFKTILLKTS